MECPKCGNKKLSEKDRCCLECGALNPYNKRSTIFKEIVEIEDKIYRKSDKDRKKNVLFYKWSFVFDIFYIIGLAILIPWLFEVESISSSVLVGICLIYRIPVLKRLLYKSDYQWQTVYIPIYGLMMYFSLGIISLKYQIVTVIFLIFLAYWGWLIPNIGGVVGGNLSFLTYISYVVLFIYMFIFHIKVCDGYAFRFKKDNKFKILLIIFWPICILILAFNKESGRINLEDESDAKV